MWKKYIFRLLITNSADDDVCKTRLWNILWLLIDNCKLRTFLLVIIKTPSILCIARSIVNETHSFARWFLRQKPSKIIYFKIFFLMKMKPDLGLEVTRYLLFYDEFVLLLHKFVTWWSTSCMFLISVDWTVMNISDFKGDEYCIQHS